MTKVYVSYGSNMDVTQMMERCPDARLKGRGVLRDYELVFRRSCTGFYASIDRCKGSKVPVIVWNISEDDEASLDGYEGYPAWYDKTRVTVELKDAPYEGEITEAMTYVLLEDRLMGVPMPSYYNKIERAYERFSFSIIALKEAYVGCLMRNLQDLREERFSENEVRALVENLVKAAIPHEGSKCFIWEAGNHRHMPGDAVYDFVKTPTAAALGFLAFAYRYYEAPREISGIDEAISKAMNGCIACGLKNHGYSADRGFVRLMKILVECETDMLAEEWKQKNRKFFVFMKRSLDHLEELAEGEANNSWSEVNTEEVKEILAIVKGR